MILIAELFTKKNSGEIARKRLKHLLTAVVRRNFWI